LVTQGDGAGGRVTYPDFHDREDFTTLCGIKLFVIMAAFLPSWHNHAANPGICTRLPISSNSVHSR
jgi:hypothetical protein